MAVFSSLSLLSKFLFCVMFAQFVLEGSFSDRLLHSAVSLRDTESLFFQLQSDCMITCSTFTPIDSETLYHFNRQ